MRHKETPATGPGPQSCILAMRRLECVPSKLGISSVAQAKPTCTYETPTNLRIRTGIFVADQPSGYDHHGGLGLGKSGGLAYERGAEFKRLPSPPTKATVLTGHPDRGAVHSLRGGTGGKKLHDPLDGD